MPLQVWARAQGLEGEPDGINGALLSLLAAHLAASGALVRRLALLSRKHAHLPACLPCCAGCIDACHMSWHQQCHPNTPCLL